MLCNTVECTRSPTYQTQTLANGSSSHFPQGVDNLPADRCANCMSFHMTYGKTLYFPRRCRTHLTILTCPRAGQRGRMCRQLRKETPFHLPKPKQTTRSSSSSSLIGLCSRGNFVSRDTFLKSLLRLSTHCRLTQQQ